MGYSKFHLAVSLIVIFFTTSNISIAQKKMLPKGFPVDCPLAQSSSKKEMSNSSARIASDSLVKKAEYLLRKLNKENILGAIAILEKAAKIDSTNARVFYQLSSAYGSAPRYAGMIKKTGDEKSLSYFLKAFTINPNAIEGLRGMANFKLKFQNDYYCAEKLLLRILESQPKNSRIRFEYAILMAAKGKFNEAYQIREKALTDADSLTSLFILNNSSRMRYMAHDYNWVIKHSDEMIANNPMADLINHFFKGLALAEQGKYEQNLAEQKLATPSLKGDAGGVANLARAYILAGDISNGKIALQEVLDRYAKGEHVVKYQIATVYEALGDFDNTFLWLNRNIEDGGGIHDWIIWLDHDPRWKRIKNDLRFKELKVKAGLLY
jgi:tetratricopeptide (TPR) repeat protein